MSSEVNNLLDLATKAIEEAMKYKDIPTRMSYLSVAHECREAALATYKMRTR